MSALLIIILILVVLVVIFTLQNQTAISIHLFSWEITDAPLVLVLISCIVIGFVFALLLYYPRLWRLKKDNRKLKKLNKKYEDKQKENAERAKDEDNPEGIAFEKDDGKYPFLGD